ncbi:MAG: 1-acyl-sn-glycerol-3-phosphate acyltransferase [Gemmatimonadetes bacterium]|nr:1-acyl-sn-glycerol-3-phosphate acyltransferase [Gemmatimonadota bacterium]
MLRTLWFLIVLFIFTLFWGLIAIIAGVLGVPNRPGGIYDHCTSDWSATLLRAAGAPVRSSGVERIPSGGVVFASNHQSWFDIFALAVTVPGQMRFVSKLELSRIPVLGRAMRSAGHIFVNRQVRGQAIEAYEVASRAIRAGLSAVVFPEGTRSRTGELQPFKKGAFVLAIAAQAPVVPVYCAGTYALKPKGAVGIKPHPIAVMFGAPIMTTGMTYEDRERLMDECHRAVEQLREESRKVLSA